MLFSFRIEEKKVDVLKIVFVSEPKKCNIEVFRALLGVTCDSALLIANLMGGGVFILMMAISLIVVKKR